MAAAASETEVSTHSSDIQQTAPQARSWNWWLRRLYSAVLMLSVFITAIAVLGVAQRLGFISAGIGTLPAGQAGADQQTFTCPMHPQIRNVGAGSCPICGMPLVPASAGGGSDVGEFAVNIQPAARRLANIQTARVQREPVVTTLETVGAIMIDESRMVTVASYIDGRLERLFADYTGVTVSRGDHLAVVYSPELYSAQIEYLESRRMASEGPATAIPAIRDTQTKLATSGRQRLVELGMTDEQILELEQSGKAQSRLTIFTPTGGTVIEKLAVEGKYVKAGEPIYRIADLSTVWLKLELYPEDAALVRFGQQVNAVIQSSPGHTIAGRVAFVDPTVNDKNRTVGVRVEFLNEDGRLRPGDYATANVMLPIGSQGEVYDEQLAGRWISPMHPQIISDQPGACPICGMDLVPTSRYGYADSPVEQPASLWIPRSAALLAGSNSVVYVETEQGHFEIRPVTIGPLLKDQVVIINGLKEGETVATSGNFLIDSQMQLAGKPSLIDPARAIAEQRARKEPLEFDDINITNVSGNSGRDLEQLFASYFLIQATLASDQLPKQADVAQMTELSTKLAASPDLTTPVIQLLTVISEKSQHLHHVDIEKARLELFRPISHAVVALATQARGEDAMDTFSHMFCPMVKGGAGDWLQKSTELRNPYWGSKMLTCGEIAHTFPATERLTSTDNSDNQNSNSDARSPSSSDQPDGLSPEQPGTNRRMEQ